MPRLAAAAFVLAALGIAFAALRPAQDVPQPAPEHAELLEGVGEWEGTLSMMVPGMPSDGIPCTETVSAVGGFWTTSKFTCDFGGAPFVGAGSLGFDSARGLWVGTWIDSMTTRLTVMEGKVDPKTQALVMRYTGPHPLTGEMVPHRVETVHQGADAYTSTFFMGEGEGQKHMVIAMRRVKK